MSEDNVVAPAETAADAVVATQEQEDDKGEAPVSPIAAVIVKARRFRIPIALSSAAIAALITGVVVLGGSDRREVTLELSGPTSYYEFPDFLADLTPSHQRRHHIQLSIVAQALDHDLGKIEERQLEVSAAIQSHLRDQTPESLTGQAGAEKLRADLIGIINQVIAPAEVRNVLFTRILIN